jgi:carboxypeptidase Taq
MANTAFDDLMAHWRRIGALSAASGLLAWDQEVTMPRAGAAQRAEELGALAEVIHREKIDPRVGDWLDAAKTRPGSTPVARAAAPPYPPRLCRATPRCPARLPPRSRASPAAPGHLGRGPRGRRLATFLADTLAEVVRLKRAEAAAIADGGRPTTRFSTISSRARGAEIAAMFGALRPRLVALRDRILGPSASPRCCRAVRRGRRTGQLAREMAERLRL